MRFTLVPLILLCPLVPFVRGGEPHISAERQTLLYVETSPPGARIVLDGKVLGRSTDLFEVKSGVRRIVVELEGHDPDGQDIVIRADEITRLVLQLKQRAATTKAAVEAAESASQAENETVKFARRLIDANFDGACCVVTADIDRDGDLDVLGAANRANHVTWWENNGPDADAWTPHPVDGRFKGAHRVAVSDVDGDGDLDVLAASVSDDKIGWWENKDGKGRAWTPHTVDHDFNGAICVGAADLDKDGDVDIFGAALHGNEIAWWENVEVGVSWTKHSLDRSFSEAVYVGAADIDGDGHLDVFGAAYDDNDIAWWKNQPGADAWAKYIVDDGAGGRKAAHAPGVQAVEAVDMDRDGDLDVVSSAYLGTPGGRPPINYSGLTRREQGEPATAGNDYSTDRGPAPLARVTWWENTNRDGTNWRKHTIEAGYRAEESVCTADLDGDGDVDVLAGAAEGETASWFENGNGAATAWIRHRFPGEVGTTAWLQAVDLDGDGDLDVMHGQYDKGEVGWWENRGSVSPTERIVTRRVVEKEYEWRVNPATGHYYTLTDLATWPEAQAEARRLGGNLVTVNDAAENAWLTETYRDSPESMWIGLIDKNKNGRWVWISGENAVYRNWAPRQPSGVTEDCGEITLYKLRFRGADPGMWNDYPAEEGAQRGIVERNSKPSTTE